MDDQTTFARKLRRDQTPAERRFWVLLLPWRTAGWHFRRQAPIGPFVVDFVCKREKLIFEIDGDSHYFDEGIERDIARTAYLRRLGYTVVRFSNDNVLDSDEGVFEALRRVLGEPDLRS
ncbi:Very-short-patch-repair endonuclease [Devosia crocina]|uniref:Very-short-patch-repair endonuclease n=1 Tax=Devosia crocina TaxID=429728 RepID=A0A1I7N581_9HYPH|nr:endonuclease domain-containing protein [Devosia crocina]SFV29837.1 Very-short-patch-repair endonuclease [Devosia crocina]